MRSLIEILIAAAVLVGVKTFVTIPYSGSIAVIATLIVVTIILLLRKESWRGLGLRFPNNVSGFIGGIVVTIAAVAAVAVTAIFGTPYIEQLVGAQPPNALSSITTLQQYLLIMMIAWTTAAIGEELLFRGFLMNRLADVFGGGASAWALAVVAQAVLFGVAHSYQGLYGIILTGIVGLIFGVFYLVGKRNLLPLILAHGIVDTISLSQTYFGSS